jgi:hypothetical protein
MRWTRQRRARMGSQGGFFEPVSGATARRTNDASAYGEVVWSWHPLLMPSPRRRVGPTGPRQAISADDGGKRNSSPGRARRKPFQPLRAGMPGVSGVPVVTGSCAFHHSHARLRVHRHPAFPTPSTGGSIWRKFFSCLGHIVPRECGGACVTPASLRGASATKQSMPPLVATWIASLAPARTVRIRGRMERRIIVSAIRDRDAEAAEIWMRRHIVDSRGGCELAHLDMEETIDRLTP